ncbi:hypothetical protein AJ79_04589 [Helicocarpus griseus UAMH5409]|uniref:Uncharacterized protein n=1 Tax=Helicocarpus griseus UAMH5409 TaxID=1447875 RepID=A0A2B7XTT2_9EURO|nr:hypothetical protein AJ79_04589 [Helicocarpus griseus UAMH5409]
MTPNPQEIQRAGPYHGPRPYQPEYRYPVVFPEHPPYPPYLEQWRWQYPSYPLLGNFNPYVGMALLGDGKEKELPEARYAGETSTVQGVRLPPSNPYAALSDIAFNLFGKSFPECNNMTDMYRPRNHTYSGNPEQANSGAEIGCSKKSPGVLHVDISKTWKGLSSDKAEELLFWEKTFKEVIGRLLHEQLELLEHDRELTHRSFRNREQRQRKFSDGVHYLPISMIDIATTMISCSKEHRRVYHWLASMGNIYKTVAQFVRTHDCFVYHPIDRAGFDVTGGLRIGVKLRDPDNYFQRTVARLSGTPVEVNWVPDMLSFEEYDPITTEGHEFRLIPQYHSTFASDGTEGALEPPHMAYESSAPWLRWDPSIPGFCGTVPFFSCSEERALFADEYLTIGSSPDEHEEYTLRIIITAKSEEFFGGNVKFEKTVRAKVTINIKRKTDSKPATDQVRGFQRLHANKQNNDGGESPQSNTGPIFYQNGKWHEGLPLPPKIDGLSDAKFMLFRDPPDSSARPALLSADRHTSALTAEADAGTSEKGDTPSSPVPLEAPLLVPPLRRQKRFSQNTSPFKLIPKLEPTGLSRMKSDRPDYPRSDSGDKRLHHDIVDMLTMPPQYSQFDEDLEERYRPWEKGSYWRYTNIPAQKKDGCRFHDFSATKSALFSDSNSNESRHPQAGSNKPSSEYLTMNCGRFLTSQPAKPLSGDQSKISKKMTLTAPPSDICPCGFQLCTPPDESKAETSSDEGSAPKNQPPLVREEDKAAFAQMIVQQAEEELRMLGSDIGDIFNSSTGPASAYEWDEIGTDEKSENDADDEDSDPDETNQGVSISGRSPAIEDESF